MLRDEFPSQNLSVVTPIKHKEQAELESDIERFLSLGGSITPIPTGLSGDPEANRFIRNEFDPSKLRESADRREKRMKGAKANKKNKESTTPFYDNLNRAKKRSQWGEGISTSGNYFVYTYASIRYGVGEKLNHEQCLELRTKVRNRLGLPPALY